MFRRLMFIALPVIILAFGLWLARAMITTPENDTAGVDETPALASGAPGDIPTVATITLATTTAAPEWLLYGQWLPQQRLDKLAPIAAEVIAVDVQVGDRVAVGDRLVQVATTDLERQRAQLLLRDRELATALRDETRTQAVAEAALETEQALVNIAGRAVERLRDLEARNLAAASDLEEAERNLQQQRLSLRQQEQQVAGHEDRLERINIQQEELALELADITDTIADASVRAPFSGQVAAVPVEVGTVVSAQAPLVTLVNTEQGRVEALLPQQQSAALTAGMTANLQYPGDATRQIALTLTGWDPVSRGGSLQLRFEPVSARPDWSFFPVIDSHYPVLLQLPAQTDVWVLPITSLYENQFVYQVSDAVLTRRAVDVVGYQGRAQLAGDNAAVPTVLVRSSELRNGDTLLSTRLANAISGLPVLIREDRP